MNKHFSLGFPGIFTPFAKHMEKQRKHVFSILFIVFQRFCHIFLVFSCFSGLLCPPLKVTPLRSSVVLRLPLDRSEDRPAPRGDSEGGKKGSQNKKKREKYDKTCKNNEKTITKHFSLGFPCIFTPFAKHMEKSRKNIVPVFSLFL